jgi:hypothetical protein
VLDPAENFVTYGGVGDPAVAFDGANFVVAYGQSSEYCLCSDTPFVVMAALVSPAGLVTNFRDPVAEGVAYWARPAVASDGTNSLIVWTDARSGPETTDIYGTRVDRALDVLDGTGVPISTAPGNQVGPAVAYDGTRYLVVWTDHRSDEYFTDIYGARVGRSGVVRDPDGIAVSPGPGRQSEPSVTANGRFLVVWRDEPDNFSRNITGARVNGGGHVLDPAGIPIATDETWEDQPAVIAGPGRRFAVGYQRYTRDAPFNAQRVYLRQVAPK